MKTMKIQSTGLLPELAAMPQSRAMQYCEQRIEECIKAIEIAEGRAQPEPPRITLAQCMPLFPRGRT
jgi:hypothetical protein